VTVLAKEIAAGCRQVDIERPIAGGCVGEGEISAFDRIPAASLGVALQAVRAHRFVNCLRGLVHRHGHGVQVGHEDARHLLPTVGLLVTEEAVDVLELGLGNFILWHRSEADMTVTADLPVSEDVDAVAVDPTCRLPL
jgi:hypothetical protein